MKTLLAIVTVVVLGMKQINSGTDRARADADAQVPNGKDPSAALAKGMSDALTATLQGIGGAMCGTIKETCKQDFYGPVCQSALTDGR